MIPGSRPAAFQTDSRRYVELVLPLVPVTPTSSSESVGSFQNAEARKPAAAATSPVTIAAICGGTFAGSQTIAAAPRLRASSIYAAPSTCVPGTATNRSPGSTRRESTRTPVIGCAGATPSGSTRLASRPRRSARPSRSASATFVRGGADVAVIAALCTAAEKGVIAAEHAAEIPTPTAGHSVAASLSETAADGESVLPGGGS